MRHIQGKSCPARVVIVPKENVDPVLSLAYARIGD